MNEAPTEAAMGGFALLRVAGLPVRHWLAGAAPELFALLRQLDRAEARYADLAGAAAERLGTELIPHPDLPAAHRRRALSLRRKLHNGVPVAEAVCRGIAATARTLEIGACLPSLLDQVAVLAAGVQQLITRSAEAHAAERHRLLDLPWRLLNEDPVGRRALGDGVLPPADDIRRRLARGEEWTTKRMRRRSDYLWRMLARATVKTTPRTWLTHVALAGLDGGTSPALTQPELADLCAVERVESVHAPRRELALSGQLTPRTLVAIASLRHIADEHAQFWTVDPANTAELRSLIVRRTAPLSAIAAVLDGGARTVAEVVSAVLGPEADDADRAVLADFVGYLATVGVVEPSTPPRKNRPTWERVTRPDACDPVRSAERDGGYVDVYRATDGSVSSAACAVVEQGIRQVLRIHALLEQGPAPAPRFLSRLSAEPRPVLDVLADRLTELMAAGTAMRPGGPAVPGPGHPSTGWRPPVAGTAYHELVAWIDDHAAATPAGATLRLDAALLDAVGAPEVELAWPMDCTVRPVGSGREAVLDMLAPAGTLDARFTQALEALHGPLPHVAAYREFLAELDGRTGVASIELMIPPLNDVAANAVRRPAYTPMWTGDADIAAYCDAPPGSRPRFLPLSRLTIRRDGDSAVVEAGGRPVRVLYHSTRVAPWPWSMLTGLLMTGNEQQSWTSPRLRCPLVAMPDRAYLPRLAMGDLLLLSPAQWRLSSGRFWNPLSTSELDKARRLAKLREETGMPRFVVVYGRGRYRKPYPCDLESLVAVEVVERALGAATGPTEPDWDVYIEEMLPAPDEMPGRDRAHRAGDRGAAEMMLRVPHRLAPAELAARAASRSG
jgi:hypothetical protein